MNQDKKPRKKKKKDKKAFVISLIVLAALLAAGLIYVIKLNQDNAIYTRLAEEAVTTPTPTEVPTPTAEPTPTPTEEPTPEAVSPEVVLNPSIEVDFEALNAVNEDVYGWIHIDGTTVSYPVYQSDPEDPDRYLRTNPVDGSETIEGAIYSESNYNPEPLEDPVTVVYGHNLPTMGSIMFTNLHGYEEEEFRAEHPYIEFYSEDGRVRYYRVVASVTYDNSLILAKFDTTTREGYQAFLDSLDTTHWDPTWIDEEWERSTDNRLLVCSTCNGITHDQRYLVLAVQVDYYGEPITEDLYNDGGAEEAAGQESSSEKTEK